MITELSIVMPCEKNRVPLLINTLGKYMKFGFPYPIEFIIVTRTIEKLIIPGLDIKLIKYVYEGTTFNPSKALNLGVKNSQYKNVLITCPEVKPYTNVLKQMGTHIRKNMVCQVYDLDEKDKRTVSLVHRGHRHETPAMYFLALFKKEDLEAINGWDLNFMKGYAWEDTDFGARFVRAQLSFEVHDGIIGEHQFHPRGAEDHHWNVNHEVFVKNNKNHITKAIRGLNETE